MSTLANALGGTLLGIDHVGFAVVDLDEAIARWQGQFGFVLDHREINQEQGVEEVMLAIPGGHHIQLLAALTPESTIAKFIDKHGEGMQQLAFRVTDINEAMERVSQVGMRLVYDTARRGTAESRINFIHPKDTGGILVELVELADATS